MPQWSMRNPNRECPRIAVVGIAIESSAYAAHRAGHRDFRVRRGADVLDAYLFLADGEPTRAAADWVGVLTARSIPGGRVRADIYRELHDEIVAGLAALLDDGGVDGILCDIHGAMSAEGM
ncbi:hypothetical protein GCM10010910_28160 [Microbacterium nanhaiense]|uniref:Microcystin LR degradation protein MlrC N-terminal domain-containing protein n=1 Tax=Microbacterium nanhaiense TaxID=1301026 RepID=A0ABQ2N3G7_9MICO|nr:hypothetical protein GCM10010910_28160 [Microbacterium nanhaiense]